MRILLCNLILLFLSNAISGQNFFKAIHEAEVATKSSRSIIPQKYQVSDVDINNLKRFLRNEVTKEVGKTKISLLNPTGQFEEYVIFEVEMMEEGLAEKYPSIKTYKGYHAERAGERVHLGISPTGFYATVVSHRGSYSIDRYADKQDRYYISYYHRDHIDEGAMSHTCGTKATDFKGETIGSSPRNSAQNLPLRVYRFALACTGEFGAFYGPEKEDVLGEMMKSVARMNLALENDFAIRLVLIADNDKLIWTDASTDPYPDGNTGKLLLDQNTSVLSTNVGFGSFDIGHVYTRGCDDTGGIAFLESACAANKGGGVSCHYSNDITAMAIRVGAHEVGHQLGSNHTFNNCSGNENPSTAYEPGSGSTIMSYGGLCMSQLNVIGLADDYYHVSSIIEVTKFTRELFGNTCATKMETNNNIPEINIDLESGFYLPISTPFALTGRAIDDQGDELTYTWEQFDLGPAVPPGSPAANSPLFVSSYPNDNPTRTFPNMDLIVNNSNDKREVLPDYARDMNFMFVVRDNNPESGGVAWEKVNFFTAASAGPFLVDFPNSLDTFKAGEEIEVFWDVANTDQELVNCQSVNILLSLDGGYTYDDVLISKTPNDGREKIFIPNLVSSKARIKIEAADNIFFDISNEDFTITEADEPGYIFGFGPKILEGCVPDEIAIEIESEALLGYDQIIDFKVASGLQEGISVSFTKASILPGESTTATVSFTDPSISGEFILEFWAISNLDTVKRELFLYLTSLDFGDIQALTPAPGEVGTMVAPFFTWHEDSDAEKYRFLLSDNPSFDPEVSNLLYDQLVTDTFFELDDILSKSTLYYWTVVGENDCGLGEINDVYTFGTEALSCSSYAYNDLPLGISQSGVIEINLPIEVLGEGQVTDVNVLKIRGTHTWVSELKGELISPSGLEVLLFNKKCGNQSNFNAGFDDDAVGGITCPLNQGIFYQPQEKLDTFTGEDIAGTWIFRLTDTQVGNGGTVQEYVLELCSNVVFASPILVVNNQMPLPSGVGRRISPDFLLAEDENNSSEELTYTLVKLPQNGLLRRGELDLSVGDQFTQKDINELNIRYQHSGEEESDDFVFTVEDGEGGWVDLTSFEILIDNNTVLSVEDAPIPDYKVFPNPSRGLLTIQFEVAQPDVSYRVFDLMGRSVSFQASLSQQGGQINLSGVSDGIYFIEIIGKDFRDVKKVYVAME